MEVSAVFVAWAGTLVTSGTCCLPAMKMLLMALQADTGKLLWRVKHWQ